MKALPLYQPWASLVACGAKRIETRHWATPGTVLGTRVAIYATVTSLPKREEMRLLEWPVFAQALRFPLGLEASAPAEAIRDALPRAAILGTVVVDRCREITAEKAVELERRNPAEHAFGNYSLEDGPRYAWVLKDLAALDEPIGCRPPEGFRGGFFTLPDDIALQLGAEPQGALL